MYLKVFEGFGHHMLTCILCPRCFRMCSVNPFCVAFCVSAGKESQATQVGISHGQTRAEIHMSSLAWKSFVNTCDGFLSLHA